jgi:hypothetical protein
MTITKLIGLGVKMIEIALLLVTWYVIGILSMLWIQSWSDKLNVAERKAWPGHAPTPDVGTQEVLVLGICGPLVLCAIAYFTILMWWLTRNEE